MPYALDARATALPRSLALSSLSYLTVVVLLLLLRALVHAPAPTLADPFRPVEFPPNDFKPYVPQPPGLAPPVVHPAAIPPVPTILPTDDPVKDEPPLPFSPTAHTVDPGTGSTQGTARPGEGTGTPAGQPTPEPGTFEYTESLPVLVHKVDPVFPEIARQAGMDGKVTLWMRVGTDGRVHEVRVVGEPSLFDEEASKAARQFVFTPATTDGHAVAVWVRMAIRFVLRD